MMQLSIRYSGGSDEAGSGPVQVGWFLNQRKGSVVFYPPERVRTIPDQRDHAKSAARCPAVINLESRHFLIRCPYDLRLGYERDKNGKPALRNLAGDGSAIRSNKLREKIHIVAEREWRHSTVPTLQLVLPYVFIADEPVYLSQLAPFMHFSKTKLPGTIFGGRFPINVWPRPLMWAFEWHDTEAPLVVQRGDPLFYVNFETLPQDRNVALSEAEFTSELEEYMEHISGAVNYVSQTFSLFEAAEQKRPAQLLKPLAKG